jgi:hypothetical protein
MDPRGGPSSCSTTGSTNRAQIRGPWPLHPTTVRKLPCAIAVRELGRKPQALATLCTSPYERYCTSRPKASGNGCCTGYGDGLAQNRWGVRVTLLYCSRKRLPWHGRADRGRRSHHAVSSPLSTPASFTAGCGSEEQSSAGGGPESTPPTRSSCLALMCRLGIGMSSPSGCRIGPVAEQSLRALQRLLVCPAGLSSLLRPGRRCLIGLSESKHLENYGKVR